MWLRIPYATYQGVVKEIFDEASFPWVSQGFRDQSLGFANFQVLGPQISKHAEFEGLLEILNGSPKNPKRS